MVRKLFKSGNSLVVALPRELLDTLQLQEGDEVAVELDDGGRQIVIAPLAVDVEGVDETFARQVAEFIEEYRPALQALAR
jgi:putative addiction module antidote